MEPLGSEEGPGFGVEFWRLCWLLLEGLKGLSMQGHGCIYTSPA